MRFVFSSLIALAMVASLPRVRGAEEEKDSTEGVDLMLVSESSAVVPGKPFTVGLKVSHHEGFHTYWLKPGIVGVPFVIEWDLPQGFKAGPIQWPYPQRVKMAAHDAHGYERDVTLLVEITPPAEVKGTTVPLKAKASWMACAAGCHPETKRFTLEMPVAETALEKQPDALAIARARKDIPRPLTGWEVTVESEKDAPEIRVKFTRQAGNDAKPGTLYFFSSDGQVSSEPAQQMVVLEDGFRLIAKRSDYGPRGATTLPGVVTADAPLGKDQPKFAAVEGRYR